MSWLSEAFGNRKNPSQEANQYYNQIPGAAGQYLDPYINQGQSAGGKLTGQYDQMTQNPGEFFSKLGEGYKESPGYQFKLQQALNEGANASARGGMLGTPQDQQYAMKTANDYASEDYNDYMKNMLGIFGLGQQGQQGMQEQGFKGSQDMASTLAQLLGQQGNNAFSQAQGENANKSQNWANLFSGIGAAGSWWNSPKK